MENAGALGAVDLRTGADFDILGSAVAMAWNAFNLHAREGTNGNRAWLATVCPSFTWQGDSLVSQDLDLMMALAGKVECPRPSVRARKEHPMHVLVAEDVRTLALPVIAFLQGRGHRVTHVQDGLAAVEVCRKELPDIVLMDVVMPEMDGIEATRLIKKIAGSRWVPVMMLTGLASKEEIIAGFDAGADDYLIKPVDLDILNARLRSMQRIATLQESLHGILDNVYEAILTINEQGIVQSYNLAAERIFGYSAAEVVDHNVKMLMPAPYAEEHDGYLARYLREGQPRVIGVGRKVEGKRKNGQVFPMRLAVTEIKRIEGRVFIGLIIDISAEEEARQRIEFLALHDPLTGLPNRTHFNETLEATLKTAGGAVHALLFIDLDGFKPINDTLGHEAGDEALKIVSSRLRHALSGDDMVARLGGDEFVVIAHAVSSAEAAMAIGNRLLAALSRPMLLLGNPYEIGASIGIALIAKHGVTADEVLTSADNAMYIAKRGGKNRSVLAP